MKQVSNFKCPKCGSEEFITKPNRYDCLRFVNGQFQVEKSEFINEKVGVFCRGCGAEVDEKALVQN
jgi:predicted nucleic-acid-binding Zn-ribbon protein